MSEKFKVEVVTPKGVLLEKDVEEVVAPGVLGEFGVLKGHTSMLTFIKPGILSYLENDRFTKYAVGPGFCEVLKDSVTVLVDEAYSAEEIDSAGATQEVSELEKELEGIDSAADPQLFEKTTTHLKVARAKVTLTSGGGA